MNHRISSAFTSMTHSLWLARTRVEDDSKALEDKTGAKGQLLTESKAINSNLKL